MFPRTRDLELPCADRFLKGRELLASRTGDSKFLWFKPLSPWRVIPAALADGDR